MNRITRIIAVLVIFFNLLIYPTNFFVNKNATGSNNGSSWENAWNSFSSINWSGMNAGDILFISGGTVSTIYNESMTIGRSDITITKGLSTGHNGRVILRSPTTQSGTGISITNRQNIKIMNLEFEGWDFGIDARGTVTNGIDSILVQNNRFSCYSYAFYTQGGSTASDSAGNKCHDIYILDNHIEQPSGGSNADIQIDGLSFKCARNIFVIGNSFINRDTQTDDTHSDFVEGQWNTNQYYFNNFFYIENTNTVGQNGVQHGGNSAGDFYFVNNIFMMGQYTTQSAVWSELFGRDWGNMRVVNNTFIGANPRFLYLGGYPKAVIKNNLFWNTRTMGSRPSFIYVEAEDGETDELVVENNNFYYNGTQEYMTGTNTPPRPVSNGWFLESSYQPTLSNFTVSPETYSNCPYTETPSDYYITSGSTREWGTGEALIESDFPTSPIAPSWFKVWGYIGEDGNGNPKSQWDIGAVDPYSNVGGDVTAPQLVSASLSNSTTLVLNFSEALNSSTAQNKNNYSISNGITVSSAVLSGTQVTLTTSAHLNGAYTVIVNNVTDIAGNVVNPNNKTANYNYNNGDVTPPRVVSATLTSTTKLVIVFSEALNSSTAQNKNNYSISNGVSVSSAVLSGTQVTLTTSAHIPGAYTVTVINVTDLAGNIINPLYKTANYISAIDNVRPYFTRLTMTSSTSITVNFSEKLDPVKAKNRNNYSINYNRTIYSVVLLPDSMSVKLNTSYHMQNKDYTLTISNITDRAGNIISPNPKLVIYRRSSSGNTSRIQTPIEIAVSNNWDPNYLPGNTIDGQGINEPSSRWLSNVIMPDTIIFDMGNIFSIDSLRISFYQWNSDRLFKYSLYGLKDSSNWEPIVVDIWSDSSEWTEIEFDSTQARFVKLVLLESNQSEPASIWEIELFGPAGVTGINNETEIPNSYTLSQNYPNPFNPTTKISYTLPEKSKVSLKIFDVLGAEVVELVNREQESGEYHVDFNANSLPSGVYLYRLETKSFVETKKMILLK